MDVCLSATAFRQHAVGAIKLSSLAEESTEFKGQWKGEAARAFDLDGSAFAAVPIDLGVSGQATFRTDNSCPAILRYVNFSRNLSHIAD